MAKSKTMKTPEQEKVAAHMNEQPAGQTDAELESMSVSTVDEESLPEGWGFDQWERASSTIWRPEPGFALMGTYQKSEPFTGGEFDADCLVHYVQDYKTGNIVSFVGGAMLDKFMSEAPIGKGTKVFIKYLDQSITKKERRVNNWDVRYDASTAVTK